MSGDSKRVGVGIQGSEAIRCGGEKKEKTVVIHEDVKRERVKEGTQG